MTRVSSAQATPIGWLLVSFADIVKLARDGKRTSEQLLPLKTVMQAVIDGKEFQVVVSEPEPQQEQGPNIAAQLAAWQRFYFNQFNLTCDFSQLPIPKQRKGFNQLIVVAQGLTIEQVFQQCQQHFPCWKYADRDLDIAIPENDRTPNSGAYAIWVRDTVEADSQHRSRSANWLKQKHIPGITLLERLLLELKYFTGKHLDIQNITLCSGSRSDAGDVPHVNWGDDRLRVHWYNPDCAGGDLRAREVVADA